MRLLARGLSTAGYVTASTIIGLENVLDAVEGWTSTLDRERGSDPTRYYVRIFGDPLSGTWAWRFGGHHISLHHTVLDGEAHSCTPCFLGADPASSPLLGPHPLRPLAGAEDLGRDLVRSLDDSQRARAVISAWLPPTSSAGTARTVATAISWSRGATSGVAAHRHARQARPQRAATEDAAGHGFEPLTR